MENTRHNSVADMLNSFNEPSLSEAVKDRIAARKIVSTLVAMRLASDLSQEDMATELGCSQSRISKLERGDDDELRWRDIKAYAHAADQVWELNFTARDGSLASRVKHHAFAIREALSGMVQLAHKDNDIAEGVARFHIEALLNLVKLLHDSASGLPRQPKGKHPSVEATIAGNTDTGEGEAPTASKTAREYAAC